MKNMKNLSLVLTVIFTVFIGGCINPFNKPPSSDELLNSMKTANYDNLDMNLTIDADIKINSPILKSDFLINLDTNIIKKSNLYELDGILKYDINLNNETEVQNFNDTFFLWAFAETSEDEAYLYIYDMFSDLWNRPNVPLKAKINPLDINVSEILANASLVTERDTYKVTGDTSFKQLSSELNLYEAYNDAGIDLWYLDDLNITVEMIFDESTWRLKSISFIPDLSYFDNNDEIKANKLDIRIVFNNFDKNTNISIPESILSTKNANEPETETQISETQPVPETQSSSEAHNESEAPTKESKGLGESAETETTSDSGNMEETMKNEETSSNNI